MSETDPEDVRESTPGSAGRHHAEGGMGVSSERTGHTGPGQHTTDGVRDTSVGQHTDPDAPPEQSPGGDETNPQGLEPKAGYPSKDPRS
jgi:hypothetical protein